jgi:hypothetical protein
MLGSFSQQSNNITFFSAQGCNSMAVAEFVISAIVNLADEFDFDYTQKTLGIIGVGNVVIKFTMPRFCLIPINLHSASYTIKLPILLI